MNTNVIESAVAKDAETVIQEGGIMEPVYTFRKLNSTDMFLMFRIIGKIGINEFTACFEKDSIKQIMKGVSGDKSGKDIASSVGISIFLEVANVLLNNFPKCENEIYQMLSNTSNLTLNQVKQLDMAVFAGMVIDFVKKEEFADFIKVVSKSFKLAN